MLHTDYSCMTRIATVQFISGSAYFVYSALKLVTSIAENVLRLPDLVCGTRCQSIYGTVTVSDSLNGC